METAVSGSSPALMTSRPGASNAAHANFDGGRTDPISTATTRVPMPSDQMPSYPSPQVDRRSLPHRHEHAAPRQRRRDGCPIMQMRMGSVSAEAACENMHKTFPRKRDGRGGRAHSDLAPKACQRHECAFGSLSGQTDGMASKYDAYWGSQLNRIRAELQLAATGAPAAVSVSDLPRLSAYP